MAESCIPLLDLSPSNASDAAYGASIVQGMVANSHLAMADYSPYVSPQTSPYVNCRTLNPLTAAMSGMMLMPVSLKQQASCIQEDFPWFTDCLHTASIQFLHVQVEAKDGGHRAVISADLSAAAGDRGLAGSSVWSWRTFTQMLWTSQYYQS